MRRECRVVCAMSGSAHCCRFDNVLYRAARSGESTVAQSSARGLSRDYPMMNTATIADSRGASVSRKKAIPSSIAASTPSAAVSLNSS
jgi:hypothetical protein